MEVSSTGNRRILMKELVKYIVSKTYKPLLVKYLAKTRMYFYKGIVIAVPPQVFHPGFFFSTKMLLRYISKEHLAETRFLELGAGSGLLSIYAARKGAFVTATDINPFSINCIGKNAELNAVEITTVFSDVFTSVPRQSFDYIIINPPYYKKKPSSHYDYAWYCGENGEYFQKLFKDLANYIQENSRVLMVLCDGCDLQMIKNLATENLFELKCVKEQASIIEKIYIFRIENVK